MSSNRGLPPFVIYIIGAVVMLIVGGGFYILGFKPIFDEHKVVTAQRTTLEATSVQVDQGQFRYDQLEAAQKAVVTARARQQRNAAVLAAAESSRRLPASQEINLGNGTEQELLTRTMPKWLNLPRNVVTRMERYARSLGARHGVAVSTEFSAPAPAATPGAIPRDIIAWNLGEMTIVGDFHRVMRWAEAWKSSPLLSSVDGLKCTIAGDGTVVATASLSVYIFPRGEAAVIPGAPGATTAPADGGMDTGMGGGMNAGGGGGMNAGGGGNGS